MGADSLTASGSLWVGVASQSIAPDWKVVLPYGKQEATDAFYNRNIFAKALVLKVESLEVVLVELDIIGARWEAAQFIKREIEREAGVPADRIILASVHNHSYPRLADEKVLSLVARKSARAVKIARGSLFPALVGAGKGSLPENLSINRSWAFGSVNSELFAVRFDDLAGHTRAVLFNCGIHPTCFTTSWGEGKVGMIGPEWPEYVRRQVSFQLSSQFDFLRRDAELAYQPPFTMFTYGASGDQQAALWLAELDGGKVSALKAFTDTVARELLNMIPWIMTSPRVELTLRSRMLKIPVGPWEGGEGERDTIVQTLSLNDTVFAAVPGEMVYDLGRELARRSPYRYTIPVTIANDYVGYLVDEGVARESVTYESKGSASRTDLGPTIVEALAGLLDPQFSGRTAASLPEGFQFGAVAGSIRCDGPHRLVAGVMNKIECPSSNPPFSGRRTVVASDGTFSIDTLLPGRKFFYIKEVIEEYDGGENQDLRPIMYGIPVDLVGGKTIDLSFDLPADLYRTEVQSIQIEEITVEAGGREIQGRVSIRGSRKRKERIQGRLFHAGSARFFGVSGSQRKVPYMDGPVATCVVEESGSFAFKDVPAGVYVAGFWLDANDNGVGEPGVDVVSPLSKPVVVA